MAVVLTFSVSGCKHFCVSTDKNIGKHFKDLIKFCGHLQTCPEDSSQAILMPTSEHLVMCGGMSDTHSKCAYDMKSQFSPLFRNASDFVFLR